MLEYELIKSKINDNSPLIIFIHGFGANRYDLLDLGQLFPNYHILSLEAPYKMGFGQSYWYDIQWIGNDKIINKEQAKKTKEILKEFIQNDLDKLEISFSKDDISLFGFSQGGILSYAVASELDMIKQIFCISSYYDEDIANVSDLNRNDLSIFACHGKSDEVIPYSQAVKSQDKINTFNLKKYKFITHEEGHWIPQIIIEEILNWNNDRN